MILAGSFEGTHSGFGFGEAIAIAVALVLGLVACSGREASLESVRSLHEQERYAESIAPLESLLAERPGEHEILELYVAALLAIGEPALAIWPLQKIAELPEATVEERTMLARMHLAGGTPEEAVIAAGRVLDQNPNILEALQIRIEANEALRNYEDALADVEFVLGYEPDRETALGKRVTLLLSLDRVEEATGAISELKRRAALGEGAPGWSGRFCAIDATFIYERREDEYLKRTQEAWEGCLAAFPNDALVIAESVGFFDAEGMHDRATEIVRQALEAAPESVEFKIALGQRLVARGEQEEGERLLLEAARMPGGALAWQVLVEYYDASQNLGKARTATEEVMALGEPSAPLKRFYADLLIRAGDFDAAREAVRGIEEPQFRSLLEGRLLLDSGKPRQALERLDEGIRLWPSNSIARQLAGEAAEQIGDFDRAIAEFKEAVRADESNLDALEKLARYQQAMGHAGMLRQVLGRYIRENPQDPRGYRQWVELARWSGPKSALEPIQKLGRLPGHFEEAVALGASLRASEPAEAAAYIEKHDVDLLAPASREVLSLWVKSQSQLGQHAAALELTDAAIAASADAGFLHVIRSDALAAAGRPAAEVRTSLDRALMLEPTLVSALVATAQMHAATEEVDEALALYDRALAAEPGNEDVAWAAIELLIANGRDDGVERRAGILLLIHPYHGDAAHLLARRLAQRAGELDRARALALRAMRFGAGPKARTTLGMIELERGETQGAIAHLRAVLAADANDPAAHYHLGRALARSGDVDAARNELKKALAGDPFPEAEAARAELARLGQ
jgi:tetratricopeptide (TPR) repeat protein